MSRPNQVRLVDADKVRILKQQAIRKIYKSGASDSVIEKYRKYINKK